MFLYTFKYLFLYTFKYLFPYTFNYVIKMKCVPYLVTFVYIQFIFTLYSLLYRLFVKPLYCGAFLEQSMLLNRRRVDDEFKNVAEKVQSISL